MSVWLTTQQLHGIKLAPAKLLGAIAAPTIELCNRLRISNVFL